ncbi:MAG: response regulator [Spirochaetales bacterium]|nr:response regulator [Spirochaetales bacterium]
MSKAGRGIPIRLAMIGVALVASLFTAVMVMVMSFALVLDVSVGKTRDYAESLAEAIADSAIDHLLLEMHISLEGIVEAAIGRHDVTDVLVANASGVIVACWHTGHLGQPIEAVAGASLFTSSRGSPAPYESPGFFGNLRDKLALLRIGRVGWGTTVEYGGAELGFVAVLVSLDQTRLELARLGTATLGMLSLLSLVSGWASSRLARRIAIPVEAMAANARRIAGADAPEPAPPTRIRELAELGSDLDAMSRILAAREAELESARDKALAAEAVAESASAARTAFLENASHELRTPLNGIVGLLSMLESERPSEPGRCLDELRARARVLSSIVDGMIEAAQVDGEAPTLADAPFPTAELVEETSRCGREFLSGSARELAVDVGKLPAMVLGDIRKIAQAVRQLLSNASRHAEAGPVGLRFEWRDACLVVEVSDRGPGIPPERRDELFIPFARLEDPKRRRIGGAGLGLAIARRIARAYGGDAAIEDAPEGGALIRLRFRLRVVEAAAGPVNPGTARSRDKARILLVEDESINRLYERSLLAAEGYEVDEARDGAAALELAGRARYDVVLMDIGLPDMSGIEVAAAIRRGGAPNADTPIIAVSAHDLDADRRLCAESGMNAFVAKPIRERELLERIASFAGA